MSAMWWGLVLGAAMGAMFGGVAAALVLGFLGWLGGVIVDSRRKRPPAAAAPRPAAPPDRMTALEQRVAELEARLARMEGGAAPFPAVAAVTPSIETVPTPIPEELVEPVVEAPKPPPIPQPVKPQAPNPLIAWITGGNAIARVGIVVLFIGIAFLLRYSVDHRLIPVEGRVVGIALLAFALLGFGWRLRHSRPGYALSLQGAGIGLLFFTVYGAYRLYSLIPAGVAFPLLVIVAVAAVVLAIRQDSEVLAGFGTTGGFLAPALASTGVGDPEPLFSYYLVLNLAVLATAWFRGWRSLNLLGFGFTFVIGLLWGVEYYRPEHFATVEPFLVAFFLMYVAVAVLFARKVSTPAGRMVDGMIVFGVPLVGFALQAGLLRDTEYGLAYSSAALGALYIALAGVLRAKGSDAWRLLAQAFFALGVVFATLAVPLAFDARWTSAVWALEGAAVVWFGVHQGRRWAVAFGTLLQVLAGFAFVVDYQKIPVERAIVNGAFIGTLLLAAAGLVSHLALRKQASRIAAPAFLWALLWWVLGTFGEIDRFLPGRFEIPAQLAVAAATTLVLAALHARFAWREAAWPGHLLLPAMFLFLAAQFFDSAGRPFGNLGWAAWFFAFASHLFARRWIETPADTGRRGVVAFQHAGFLILVVAVLGWEVHWWVIDAGLRRSGWASPSLVVIPVLALFAVSTSALQRYWPLVAHPVAYQRSGATLLATALWVWILAINALHNGRSAPLPYMPLVNSVDVAHVLVALAYWSWWRGLARRGIARPAVLAGNGASIAIGGAAFVWANGVLLRSLHHWADVPYRWQSWIKSFVTQASISIFWSALALGLMVWATRKATRSLWMLGATLMAVVVAKLLFVDLAHLGGLERIVSFIGVGVLMLVIGYLAPVPPSRSRT